MKTKKLRIPFCPRTSCGMFLSLVAVIAAVSAVSAQKPQIMLSHIFWYIAPGAPYSQSWSDTVSISTDDDWSNFIAITGHTGENLTAAEGVNPQTVLADGIATPLDVIANQSNPDTLADSGVAEFDGIANPTVALKGSAAADAPHLLIRINTKSCPNTKYMTVGYKVRDLDASANDAVQQVALHYRSGDFGDYTNAPSAFVADATTPNAATKVTSVFATLPLTVLERDALYIRILTTNAGGTDEWVGIDDITIGCFVPLASQASISGRVSNADGRPISGASVRVTDPSGHSITVRTNNFGRYHFDGVAIGSIYIIEVRHKAAVYTPQILTVSADMTGVDFIPTGGNYLLETEKSPPGAAGKF